MELNILNISGKDTGKKIKLSDEIFAIEPNDHVIYLDVKQNQANKRQGTHKAKERGEVKGSTKKIKRQKGTGTARAGSIKNPLYRGGGRVFGPRPRNYGFKLNKKVKQLARKSALSYKAADKNIIILEDFEFKTPKTKQFVDLNNNLKINDKKSILVLSNMENHVDKKNIDKNSDLVFKDKNKNVYLSARNLKQSKVLTVSHLTTYDVLNSEVLVLTESSVNQINQIFGVK